MKNLDKSKRYNMLIEGVVFSTLGTSLITRAGSGASPTTSLTFVLTFLPKKLEKLKKVLN